MATRNTRTNARTNGKAAAVKAAPAKRAATSRKAKGFEGAEMAFTLERETKNTYRYAEDFEGEDRRPVTLYLPRDVMGDNAPEAIVVVVEAAS